MPEVADFSLRPDRAAIRVVRRIKLAPVLVALGVVVGVPVLRALPLQPRFVRAITFQNATPYTLSVDVTGEDRDGWMPVWTLKRDETTTAREIYDIGDVWIFRFRAQDGVEGELRLTREELERNGWRLAVPAHIGERQRSRDAG